MTQNGNAFNWRPIHQRCFDMIKRICSKTPVLRPIDSRLKEPIWVVCDTSKSGVGVMYGQGELWQSCRLAGFMSKKFTNAQHNYRVHELEMLAILEALMKWEDKLVGYRIHIITDHKALEFFKTQSNLTGHQMRWMDYLSRFDFDITYIKGENNKVADCLSRYYENDSADDVHVAQDYVRADARIDPDGEDLPPDRFAEVKTCTEKMEVRDIEAQEMAERMSREIPTEVQEEEAEITVEDMLNAGPSLDRVMADEDEFKQDISSGYMQDPLFKIVLGSSDEHKQFEILDGIIWTRNRNGDRVVCILRVMHGMQSLQGAILDQAHRALGHFGFQRTSEYVRRWYWWPRMVTDTKEFCKTCEACQQCKGGTRPPSGKLHPLPIPTKPWESIGMDFVGPFPKVAADDRRKFNYLWVIVCRMTSMVHLVPTHTTMSARQLSSVYMQEIVWLHGLPSSIVSDRDSKFTSKWWRKLHWMMGSRLLMSTSFHPQTDGMTERMNRSVGQMFCAGLHPDQKDWYRRVDLTEFAINASVSDTTRFAPFELNGGYMPSMMRELKDGERLILGVRKFTEAALSNLAAAHDSIIEARVFQAHRTNKKRSTEPVINVGDLVYLSTKNLNIPKGRARKLCPKYVGPYKVSAAHPETSNYTLELPLALQAQQIHPRFHASLLRPHHVNNDALFLNRAQPEPYDFGAPDDTEWFVDEILGHRWDGGERLEFQVCWSMGDTTWEPLDNCKDLVALDRYLEVMGAKSPRRLPKKPAGPAGPVPRVTRGRQARQN
ncbi:uncharacterized protein ARMOST_19895 [Armillaria ostoyae]|uniref:Integrase catalytic domain-containing protein n=1 Tax=Armillaria ostoyae TaxID=47428 RepID=A0A284S5T8_ARMOS|nr:uncharacterized protein ARMOST_19895 [Armillaria ostoyae]